MEADSGILAICLNPVLQRTLVFDGVQRGRVNRTREYRVDASGKGVNVARVLTQVGERVTHLTSLGGRYRELFLELAERDGVLVDWVASRSEIRWCTTLVEREARSTTELVEEAAPVADGTEEQVRAAFERLLHRHHTITISGTKAPGFSAELYPDLVRIARAAGKRVVIDVAGGDLKSCLGAGPHVAKPNYDEFVATYLGEMADCESEAAIEGEVRQLLPRLSLDSGSVFVLTRGSKPALVADGGVLWEQAPEVTEPLNTTGSGDAFTAGLAQALARRQPFRDAVAAGHRLGSANARTLRPGTVR